MQLPSDSPIKVFIPFVKKNLPHIKKAAIASGFLLLYIVLLSS